MVGQLPKAVSLKLTRRINGMRLAVTPIGTPVGHIEVLQAHSGSIVILVCESDICRESKINRNTL